MLGEHKQMKEEDEQGGDWDWRSHDYDDDDDGDSKMNWLLVDIEAWEVGGAVLLGFVLLSLQWCCAVVLCIVMDRDGGDDICSSIGSVYR